MAGTLSGAITKVQNKSMRWDPGGGRVPHANETLQRGSSHMSSSLYC